MIPDAGQQAQASRAGLFSCHRVHYHCPAYGSGPDPDVWKHVQYCSEELPGVNWFFLVHQDFAACLSLTDDLCDLLGTQQNLFHFLYG